MQKQKKLQIAHSLFVLIIFTILGLIVISKKAGVIFTPKVEKKFTDYLETNYQNIKNNISFEDIKYKNKTFKVKIISKKNKNLYFYLIYQNKQVTDTYKEDYLEGKTLLTKIKKDLETEINTKTNLNCTITILDKLNNYRDLVKERILKEDNLSNLKFYKIEKELLVDNFKVEEITSKIDSLIKTINSQNITPKYYEITITNKQDITSSIKISNLDETFLTNPNKYYLINAIINNNNSKLLKENKITYEYLS